MPRYRLPVAPLRRVLLRLRATESLTWNQLAERAGMTQRHLFRLIGAHDISERAADRIACRIGLHPVLLWPEEWLRTGSTVGCDRTHDRAAV